MKDMRTAVLIHGCHLEANLNGKTWREIVFGATDDNTVTLYGRVPMGLLQAVEFCAESLIFASAGSSREGILESEYTCQLVRKNLANISVALNLTQEEKKQLETLVAHAHIDTISLNTREEVSYAITFCMKQGFERLILVSSPWHYERCCLEASSVLEEIRARGEIPPRVLGIGSYGSTEETAVSEPPHRGDRPQAPIHKLIRQAFRIGQNPKITTEFYNEFKKFISSWEEENNDV
jgi:hypothetical protein